MRSGALLVRALVNRYLDTNKAAQGSLLCTHDFRAQVGCPISDCQRTVPGPRLWSNESLVPGTRCVHLMPACTPPCPLVYTYPAAADAGCQGQLSWQGGQGGMSLSGGKRRRKYLRQKIRRGSVGPMRGRPWRSGARVLAIREIGGNKLDDPDREDPSPDSPRILSELNAFAETTASLEARIFRSVAPEIPPSRLR